MRRRGVVVADIFSYLLSPLAIVFSQCESHFYGALQVAGVFIFAFGIALIEFCVLTIARVAVPIITQPGSLSFALLFTFICVISFGILFNLIAAAVFRSPKIDSAETERLAREGELLSVRQQRRLLDAPARFCYTCSRFKAPREHHCRVCNRCVARMDHHCPWINNCVDAENNRYFCLFIFYLLVGTFAGFVLLTVPFVQVGAYMSASTTDTVEAPYGPYTYQLRGFPVVLTMTLCGVLFFCMIFFFTLSMVHVLRNETQVEHFTVERRGYLSRDSLMPFRNPYDLGRWRNLLEMLHTEGDRFVDDYKKRIHVPAWQKTLLVAWLIIPTLRPSKCDGIHYPTFDDEVMA